MPGRNHISRTQRLITLILLTIVYYVVPWHRAGAAASFVGLPLLLLHVLILPGSILLGTCRLRFRDSFGYITAAFLSGLAYFLLLAFLAALAGTSLGLFKTLLPIAVLAVAGLDWRPRGEPEPARTSSRRTWAIVFTAILAVVFVLVLRAGAPTGHTKDTLDHVGYIQEIRDTEQSFPRTAFHVENDNNGRDIRKGLLHFFYAFTSDVLGLALLPFLNIMGALFSVVLMLAVYSLALAFFDDRRVAVLSALFFIIGPGGAGGPDIRTSFYPNRFGMAFLFFFWIHAVGFVRDRRPRDAAVAGALAFAACATHVFYAVVVVFTGLTLQLWKICFPFHSTREHFRRMVFLGLAVMTGIVPYAVYRYITASPQANELHTQVQGVLFLSDALYVVDPLRLWAWLGPVGVVSFFLLAPLWSDRMRYAGLGYCISSLAMLPLVLFNPLLLPVLHKLMTYLAFRLILISPFYLLPAYFLVRSFSGWRSGPRPGMWPRLLTGFVLIAAAVQLRPLAGAALGGGNDGDRMSYTRWQDGLDYLSTLQEPVVVASDPVTSYSIPALTPHYVVCTLDQHASPNDLRVEERILAGRDILSPFVSAARSLELMNTHGATYVVLNQRFEGPMRLHYWSMDPSVYAAVRAKFMERPDLFDPVFDRDGFTVLRASGLMPAAGDPPPNPYLVDSIPHGFRTVGRQAGIAVLRAVSLESDPIERGGTVQLGLVWSTRGEHALENYVVAVRFDHQDPGLPLAGKPFPKLTRKVMEAFRGERYRFRSEHKLVGGFFGPDTWDAGQLVLDRNPIRVPSDMAPGSYRVSVTLLVVANQPNYRVHDLLFDDDVYQGLAIGQVTVR